MYMHLCSELRIRAIVLYSLPDNWGSEMLTEHRSKGCVWLPPSTGGWSGVARQLCTPTRLRKSSPPEGHRMVASRP